MYMLLLEIKKAGGRIERREKEKVIKFQAFLVLSFEYLSCICCYWKTRKLEEH